MEDQPQFNVSIETNSDVNKEPEILAADKEAFFKSILSDKPYQETFELFDGKLKLTFRAMTVQENTDVVNQIVVDRRLGTASDTDAYFVTISTYRLAMCLVDIDGETYSNVTKAAFVKANDDDSYVLARARPMAEWSTSKLSIYLDAFSKFEAKLVKLSSEVQNPNFWKASA
jgi:hypothetical protein